jgi:hypothetical protein
MNNYEFITLLFAHNWHLGEQENLSLVAQVLSQVCMKRPAQAPAIRDYQETWS